MSKQKPGIEHDQEVTVTSTHHPHTRLLAVAAALTILLGAAGCSADNAPSDSASQSLDEYLVGFAKCMRAEGIDYPDPGSNEETDFGGADEATLDAAGKRCTDKLGDPPLSDDMDPDRLQKKWLQSAKCLRDLGYDVRDPEAGDDGLQLPDSVTEEELRKCDYL